MHQDGPVPLPEADRRWADPGQVIAAAAAAFQGAAEEPRRERPGPDGFGEFVPADRDAEEQPAGQRADPRVPDDYLRKDRYPEAAAEAARLADAEHRDRQAFAVAGVHRASVQDAEFPEQSGGCEPLPRPFPKPLAGAAWRSPDPAG